MPNDSKPVEETGTYSTYVNSKNLKVLEKLGIAGLPPAKMIDRLTEKADKYHDNKKKRDKQRRELEKQIQELDEMEQSEVWN